LPVEERSGLAATGTGGANDARAGDRRLRSVLGGRKRADGRTSFHCSAEEEGGLDADHHPRRSFILARIPSCRIDGPKILARIPSKNQESRTGHINRPSKNQESRTGQRNKPSKNQESRTGHRNAQKCTHVKCCVVVFPCE